MEFTYRLSLVQEHDVKEDVQNDISISVWFRGVYWASINLVIKATNIHFLLQKILIVFQTWKHQEQLLSHCLFLDEREREKKKKRKREREREKEVFKDRYLEIIQLQTLSWMYQICFSFSSFSVINSQRGKSALEKESRYSGVSFYSGYLTAWRSV